VCLRARGYDPGLGRFTAFDPVTPGGPGTGGLNRYSYAGNNPTLWTDPSGEFVEASSTFTPAQRASPAAAATGVGIKKSLSLALLGIGALGVGVNEVIDQLSNDRDPVELVVPPDVLDQLARQFGVSRSDIANCLANWRVDASACEGLPEELLEQLLRWLNRDAGSGDGNQTSSSGAGSGLKKPADSSRLRPRPNGYSHTSGLANTSARASMSSGLGRRSSSRSVTTSPSGAAVEGARRSVIAHVLAQRLGCSSTTNTGELR